MSVDWGFMLAGWGTAFLEPTPIGEIAMAGITLYAVSQAFPDLTMRQIFGSAAIPDVNYQNMNQSIPINIGGIEIGALSRTLPINERKRSVVPDEIVEWMTTDIDSYTSARRARFERLQTINELSVSESMLSMAGAFVMGFTQMFDTSYIGYSTAIPMKDMNNPCLNPSNCSSFANVGPDIIKELEKDLSLYLLYLGSQHINFRLMQEGTSR